MARLYHRDQVGAPAISYGTATSADFEAFKLLLKACLVSGYGGFPAAGWELISEAANHIVLRPGTKSGYVCFTRESVLTVITVWLAATFSGVNAAGKIQGSGVRSGTAAASESPQRITLRGFATHADATSWGMVADESTFVMNLSGSISASVQDLSTNPGNQYLAHFVLYCGEDSAGDLISMGGNNLASVANSLNMAMFRSSGFTALKYPDTGLLVDTAAISITCPGSATSSAPADYAQFPLGLVLPEAVFSDIYWQSGGVMRRLRGVVVEPVLACVYSSVASVALGGPEVTSRTICVPLRLGDHDYMVGRTYSVSSIQVFLTTNPEFW